MVLAMTSSPTLAFLASTDFDSSTRIAVPGEETHGWVLNGRFGVRLDRDLSQ